MYSVWKKGTYHYDHYLGTGDGILQDVVQEVVNKTVHQFSDGKHTVLIVWGDTPHERNPSPDYDEYVDRYFGINIFEIEINKEPQVTVKRKSD